MSAVRWFRNYIKGHSRLYESVDRRRALRNKLAELADQETGDDVDAFFDELAEVKLVLACVVNVVLAKGLVSEEELIAAADEIDLLDGKADGKLNGKVAPDGTITPEPERPKKPPGAIDDLADAVDKKPK